MKRDQVKRRPLADSVLHALDPEEKDYRVKDSPGLYFSVKTSGAKGWHLRYKKPNGKWAWKGLGSFPETSGRVARQKAADMLDRSCDGEDLSDNASKGSTFREAAEEWYRQRELIGRSPETLWQMRLYLDKDMLPAIGDKALNAITRGDCARIQQYIEDRGAHVTAEKVRRWLNHIFSRAIALGKTENNPASELKYIASEFHKEQRYPHLLEPELPAFLKALRGSNSKRTTLIAVRMVLLTATRPGAVRFAKWENIDFGSELWNIEAADMKMKRDHAVPLATQTLEDLEYLRKIIGGQRYLFPSYGPKGPVMSENTINKAIAMVGYKGKLVGHGARHTASTLLREHRWGKDLVECQLAHKEAGVAGVYNQAQYVEHRRKMMQWYADYLDALEFGKPKPPDPA